MDHFIRLAKRGKPGTGASGGELRARRLALAVINDLQGMDDEAISGFIEFIRGIQRGGEQLARELIGAEDE
jgi:hypothetical protein